MEKISEELKREIAKGLEDIEAGRVIPLSEVIVDLALSRYDFKKPDILYSKLLFELALEHGCVDAAYYLGTIFEQGYEIIGVEYNPTEITRLYNIASESKKDDIRNLALEGLKRIEQAKLELK